MTAPDSAERSVAASLLARAVEVLTAAARQTRPVLRQMDNEAGELVWVENDGGRREPADWAEFVTLALAGAAANVGGVNVALAGRPGSWEADGVRSLLYSTVGFDEAQLLEHRTEPLLVEVYPWELLWQFEVDAAYDDADAVLAARYDAVLGEHSDPAARPDEAALARLDDLAERLERQREQDWKTYGEAVRAHVLEQVKALPGLRVPVEVELDVDTFRAEAAVDVFGPGLAGQLLERAAEQVPLPGGGVPPLDRVEAAGAAVVTP